MRAVRTARQIPVGPPCNFRYAARSTVGRTWRDAVACMGKYFLKFLTVGSLLLCLAAGWCWKRSYAFADIISRDSFGESYNLLSGVGSYRGAFIIGSLQMPRVFPPRLEINRRVYVVAQQKDRVQTAVAGRKGAL